MKVVKALTRDCCTRVRRFNSDHYRDIDHPGWCRNDAVRNEWDACWRACSIRNRGLMAAGLIGAATLTGTASPAHATGPQLTQLVAAVCDMTTYSEGKQAPDPLPQSTSESACMSRTTNEPLFIGRYTSSYDAWWHDLTHFRDFYQKMGAPENVVNSAVKGTYVPITMADGATVVFVNENETNYNTAGLAPLQAAGFPISPMPPQV